MKTDIALWPIVVALLVASWFNFSAIDRKVNKIQDRLENIEAAK